MVIKVLIETGQREVKSPMLVITGSPHDLGSANAWLQYYIIYLSIKNMKFKKIFHYKISIKYTAKRIKLHH